MRSPVCSHLLSICAKQHSGLHFIRAGARKTIQLCHRHRRGVGVSEKCYYKPVGEVEASRFFLNFFLSIYVGGLALQVQGVGFLGLHLFTGYSLRGLRDDFSLKG